MDNSFFILSDNTINISRFHICTWDVEKESSFIEVGLEFLFPDGSEKICFKLVTPFLGKKPNARCLSQNLVKNDNSKFIFNDIMTSLNPIDDDKRNGASISFKSRETLNILPIEIVEKSESVITLEVKRPKKNHLKDLCYIRLLIPFSKDTLATKNKGIARTSYIYDIKLNESRNLPDEVNTILNAKYQLCKVDSCFCFHILPSSLNILFVDQNKLKSIRELELDAFCDYLEEAKKMQKDKYIIIFNKSAKSESYSFFTVLEKEIIGMKQLSLALGANILCSFLFAFSALDFDPNRCPLGQIPVMHWISLGIMIIFVLILFLPKYLKK